MQPTEPTQASGAGQPVPAPPPEPVQPVAPGDGAGGYPPASQPQPTGYPQRTARPVLPVNLGDAVTAFGGLLVFFFSFAPFVTYASPDLSAELARSNLPTWFSAWSPETFMAPLTWFVALGGLIVAGLAATRLMVPRDREYYGFRIGHLQIGLGLFVFVTLFGYATAAKSAVFGHDFGVQFAGPQSANLAMHFGWGGYVMLLGAVLAAAGAILSYLEIGPIVYPQPPKQPTGYPPAGYGAPQYPAEQYPVEQYPVDRYAPGATAGFQPAAPEPQPAVPAQGDHVAQGAAEPDDPPEQPGREPEQQ